MDASDVKKKLADRFINPIIGNTNNYIGVEIEMPVVNLNKEAVELEVVQKVMRDFIVKYHFAAYGFDDNGDIFSAISQDTGDIISFDCSYSNLELSFGKVTDLNTVNMRFRNYYEFLNGVFKGYDYLITGMGINPYRKYNHNTPIPNGRYRMLYHHLHSYEKYNTLPMYFHKYPSFGLFSSASQVQLDTDDINVIRDINISSRLEPLKALLFSNSVLNGEEEGIVCARDLFWENSTHGINPHNIGMYDKELKDIDELLEYISTTSIYCVEKDGKYINFTPTNVVEYFMSDSLRGEYFENGAYHSIEFSPSFDDLEYLRTFKFADLTFRGTIEYRSVCTQPISDFLTVAAFHLGLKNNMDKLEKELNDCPELYDIGYNLSELRKLMILRDFPKTLDEDRIFSLIEAVLDLAREGLQKRQRGEEKFILPLYERAKKRTSPARSMLDRLDSGESLKNIIIDYSRL